MDKRKRLQEDGDGSLSGDRIPKKQKEEGKKKKDTSALNGVNLFAIKNRKGIFLLPSKKNYFGGFEVELVVLDNGCSPMLLPLQKDDILTLAVKFPFESFCWKLCLSTSSALTMKIYPIAPGKGIPIVLCSDLLHRPDKSYELDSLRFHLCFEDASAIRNSEMIFENLMEKDQITLEQFLKAPPHYATTRRTYGILGQGVLQNMVCFQHGVVCIGVDPQCFELSWDKLREIEKFAVGAPRGTFTLPDRFNDLEDEDHEGDYHHSYSLVDEDFVD